MLSKKKCMSILEEAGLKIDESKADSIIEVLYHLAQIELDILTEENEGKGDNLYPSKYRRAS